MIIGVSIKKKNGRYEMRTRLFATLFCVGTAHAQTPSMHEYCTANSMERAVAEASAMIVPYGSQGSILIENVDGTYKILNQGNVETFDGTAAYCPDVPFFNQRRAIAGRTGFLVGDRLMVTAPHSAAYDITQTAVVFGLQAKLINGVCTQPDFDHIPPENVYFPNQSVYADIGTGEGAPDYLLFKLDRSVPNVMPLPLRRQGQADAGDSLTVVGHANRLSTKVSLGGYVSSISNGALDIGSVPTWLGSSGSAVVNGRSNLIESIISWGGSDFGNWDWDYDENQDCVANIVNMSGGSFANNGDIVPFASHVPIPPTELQITPLTTVVHTGPAGGPLTNGISQFSVAAPTTATSDLQFKVGLPILLPPAPSLAVSPAPGTYTVTPGGPPLTFTVTGDVGSITSCKVVDTAVAVTPLAAGFVGWARHRFEVGMSNFAVEPNDDWDVAELGATYPTHSIVVSNMRTEAGQFTVNPSVQWIRVNGALSQTLNLSAAGTAGDHATVVLSLDDSAPDFPRSSEKEAATVTIQGSQPQCSMRNPEIINVTFAHGFEQFVGLNTYDWLPGPGGGRLFGPPVDIPVVIEEDAFQVEEIALSVGFNAYSGYFGPADADTRVRIALIAPDGTAATVWDRNDAPQSYISYEMIESGGGTNSIGVLLLDQGVTPPLGPDSLTLFNGVSGNGEWKVRLWTTDTTQNIQPIHASLHIAKQSHADLFTYNYVYDWLPSPLMGQTFGPVADLDFDLTSDAAFTVRDVDLTLGFYNGFPHFDAGTSDQMIQVQVIAPDGTTATVWDRNNAPSDYLGYETVDWLGGTPVTVLLLDDQSTPPLGPSLLGLFNGHAGEGMWTVRLRTTDTSQRILVSHAELSIER